MNDRKIKYKDGKVYVVDENFEIKGEPTSKKDLDQKLINENEEEYLTNSLNNNKVEIDKLELDINTNNFTIGALKICEIPVVIVTIILALYVAKFCDLSYNLLISFAVATVPTGFLETVRAVLKNDNTKKDKKIDYYKVMNALIKEDLAKVKEKSKSKVSYKKPDFEVEKIDTSSIDAYKTKYSNLAGVYDSIETVEAEEKPKTLGSKKRK